MNKINIVFVVTFLIITGLLFGCAGTSQSPAKTVPGPAVASSTAGQLAVEGKTVYLSSCAKCHGDAGQGKGAIALIGPAAGLAKYGSAQGLFKYISTAMPGDAPGSLPSQSYMQVLAYLLTENKYVTSDTKLEINSLSNVTLK